MAENVCEKMTREFDLNTKSFSTDSAGFINQPSSSGNSSISVDPCLTRRRSLGLVETDDVRVGAVCSNRERA